MTAMPWSRPNYEPTPAEIRIACLAIQATWSESERRRRAAGIPVDTGRYREPPPLYWTVPEVVQGPPAKEEASSD